MISCRDLSAWGGGGEGETGKVRVPEKGKNRNRVPGIDGGWRSRSSGILLSVGTGHSGSVDQQVVAYSILQRATTEKR